MGVRIIDHASVMIENTLHRSTRDALKALEEGGKDIRDLARKMAPVDEGNLEKAIKVTPLKRVGINGRNIIQVYIDESEDIPGRPGKTVGDYSEFTHEGVYKLGEKSEAKQNSNGGIKVGRKYLEYAAEELAPGITRAVKRAVGRAT